MALLRSPNTRPAAEDRNADTIRVLLNRPPASLDNLFEEPGVSTRVGEIISTAMEGSPRGLRAHAERCLRTAISSKSPAKKVALLIMADAERKLAARRKT